MQELVYWIEIFALVTGVIYVVLEIGQKNFMWYVGIATGAACAFSFGVQHLYASMVLNLYYVFVSFWGLYQWKKDARRMAALEADYKVEDAQRDKAQIHLNHLSNKTMVYSLLAFIIGQGVLYMVLDLIGDSMSWLDSASTVMSIIGTIWLAKSYYQQWYIWIVANVLSVILCLQSGMYWMTALYAVYVLSAIYGCFHWVKNGKYVNG